MEGIWGFNKAIAIDTFQNRAKRYFLGVHKFAPNAAILADKGWIKRFYNRYLCIRYGTDLLIDLNIVSQNRFLNKIIETVLQTGVQCSAVQEVFVKLDLEHIFIDTLVCDMDVPKRKVVKLMESN